MQKENNYFNRLFNPCQVQELMICATNCTKHYTVVQGNAKKQTFSKSMPTFILKELMLLAGERHSGTLLSPPGECKCFAEAVRFIIRDDTITYYLYYNLPTNDTKVVSKSLHYKGADLE